MSNDARFVHGQMTDAFGRFVSARHFKRFRRVGWSARSRAVGGFSLIELMTVLVIIAILSAIAIPSYLKHVAKTNRVAAEACLSQYANYMERYYTTNLRYDKDPVSGTANPFPQLDCASTSQTGDNYQYTLPAVSATAYTVQAAPSSNAQKTRDAACGTLTLNQTGTQGRSGTAPLDQCW